MATGTAAASPAPGTGVALGLRENAVQFALLVLVNAFVGAVVGVERSILPLLAESRFGLGSATAMLSFLVAFGLAKAVAEADRKIGDIRVRADKRRMVRVVGNLVENALGPLRQAHRALAGRGVHRQALQHALGEVVGDHAVGDDPHRVGHAGVAARKVRRHRLDDVGQPRDALRHQQSVDLRGMARAGKELLDVAGDADLHPQEDPAGDDPSREAIQHLLDLERPWEESPDGMYKIVYSEEGSIDPLKIRRTILADSTAVSRSICSPGNMSVSPDSVISISS